MPLSFPLSPLLPLQFQLQLAATGFIAGALLLLLLLLKRHSNYGTEIDGGGDMGDGIGDGHDMGGGEQEAPVVAEASTSSAQEKAKWRKKQKKRRLGPAERAEDTRKCRWRRYHNDHGGSLAYAEWKSASELACPPKKT